MKSIRPILPVLRKLAKIAAVCRDESIRDSSMVDDFYCFQLTLGDCRKVKRWLTKMEKKK